MIDKVTIAQDALELILLRAKLAEHLNAASRSDDPFHVITTPCKLIRRGQDLKFVLPLLNDNTKYSRHDPTLSHAVAKAYLWWDWIKSGKVTSLTEIAQSEGVDKAQVTRWLRLAFLSPMLVRQIMAGTHPTSLTIESLTRQLDLPASWQEQEALIDTLS